MHAFARLFVAGVCAAAAASALPAQRSVAPAKATSPSTSARAATARPDPAGLRPIFPAGLNSGSGAAVSSDPIAATTSPIPAGMPSPTPIVVPGGVGGVRVPSELPSADNGTIPATAVLGAGSSVRGPAQGADGAGGFAAADVARSFFFADANHDGELTHGEARRLSIMTMPFEEMDRNFDGVISRFEYDDSVL